MAPVVTSDLQDIHHAETKVAVLTATLVFTEKYQTKYAAAVPCLIKDTEALLAFFDFSAGHWDRLRMSDPVQSVFATIRHRTVRKKGGPVAKKP
jgi:transposase-like protein